MGPIIALAVKDLRLLLRDKLGFFFTFFFPLLIAIFFGAIFSGSAGSGSAIPITIVDLDRTEGSQRFIDALRKEPAFAIQLGDDLGAARDQVRRGRRTAYVAIQPGFGEASDRMFFGEPMQLTVGVDPSRRAEAAMIEGLLTARAFERMQDMFTDPDIARTMAADSLAAVRSDDNLSPALRAILEPFLVNLEGFMTALPEATAAENATGEASDTAAPGFEPIRITSDPIAGEKRNAYTVSFPQGIVWGILGCSAAFGISLVVERTRGTLARLRISPISQMQILLGKALACFLTTIAVAALLLIIARVFFGVIPGSPLFLALGIACVAAGFVGIMMLLSVIGKTEAAAGGIGWAVLLVMAMIGGGMVPLVAMPQWMVTLSHISPVKWAILAIEGPLWRGFTPAEMALPCAILLGIGAAGMTIGSRLFRWGVGG